MDLSREFTWLVDRKPYSQGKHYGDPRVHEFYQAVEKLTAQDRSPHPDDPDVSWDRVTELFWDFTETPHRNMRVHLDGIVSTLGQFRRWEHQNYSRIADESRDIMNLLYGVEIPEQRFTRWAAGMSDYYPEGKVFFSDATRSQHQVEMIRRAVTGMNENMQELIAHDFGAGANRQERAHFRSTWRGAKDALLFIAGNNLHPGVERKDWEILPQAGMVLLSSGHRILNVPSGEGEEIFDFMIHHAHQAGYGKKMMQYAVSNDVQDKTYQYMQKLIDPPET